MQAALEDLTANLGSQRVRVKDKRRRRMSLGAVVAMEQHKYTEDGVDTFDCAMEQFMEQTNLDVRLCLPVAVQAPPAACGRRRCTDGARACMCRRSWPRTAGARCS